MAGPDADGVVGDVLLVDVAVAREERSCRSTSWPTVRSVEPESDERLDPRALLGVDVDVREMRRVGELDEADVVVGDRVAPTAGRRRRRARGSPRACSLCRSTGPGRRSRRGRRCAGRTRSCTSTGCDRNIRALLTRVLRGRGNVKSGDVQAREHQRVERALAREVAGERREAVDVLVLPGAGSCG